MGYLMSISTQPPTLSENLSYKTARHGSMTSHIELNHSEPEVQNNFIMLVY